MNEDVLRAAACEVRDAMLSSLPEDCPHYEASRRFQRRMERLLADPANYARKMLRPWQEKTARAAAMAAVSVGLSALLLSQLSPSAWAAVRQWFKEIYQTQVVYRFSGESKAPGVYLPGWLPEGYTPYKAFHSGMSYSDPDGLLLSFMYSSLQDGSALTLSDTDHAACTAVTVNGLPGEWYVSSDPDLPNALIWLNEEKQVSFSISGYLNWEDILHMAESVSLVKTEKP